MFRADNDILIPGNVSGGTKREIFPVNPSDI